MCPNAIYHGIPVYKSDLVQIEKEMPQMTDVLVPTPEGGIQILGGESGEDGGAQGGGRLRNRGSNLELNP